jgi:hypothetical protein
MSTRSEPSRGFFGLCAPRQRQLASSRSSLWHSESGTGGLLQGRAWLTVPKDARDVSPHCDEPTLTSKPHHPKRHPPVIPSPSWHQAPIFPLSCHTPTLPCILPVGRRTMLPTAEVSAGRHRQRPS